MSLTFTTLPGLLRSISSYYENETMMNYRRNDTWQPLSTGEVYRMVRNLAVGLRKQKLKKGSTVGIIAQPSPLWVITDLAITAAGCVTVPIFKRISAENLAHETKDSGMTHIFVGLENELEAVRAHGRGIKNIIPLDMEAEGKDILPFKDLLREGYEEDQAHPSRFEEMTDSISEDQPATIIYTSGSTGLPKGVKLTHRNIISQVKAAGLRFVIDPNTDTAFSSLPLAHIFERMVMYFYLSTGTSVYFVDDLANIATLIQDVKPTIMTAVPRLLEKVQAKMQEKVDATPGVKGFLARKGYHRAVTKPVETSAGESARKALRPAEILYRKLVWKQFRESLGGNLTKVISGAAPLPKEVGRFFMNIGVPIYEGYGLTEASPVIAANYPGNNKLGTVGKAFPDVEIKISEDNEILARGPNIMQGYHNRPEETEKTIDKNGFLLTGDLGSLDAGGYLTVTGRKKELFKKSTGEYVAPVPIEQKLTKNKYIDAALVVADQRKFVSALIFPDFNACSQLQKELNMQTVPAEEFVTSEEFRQEIQKHISAMNEHLPHTEEVQKFLIIPKALSVESGELTPTMKLRRHKIEETYKDRIDSLYEEGE